MTPLERLRAAQREHETLTSDQQLQAFLAEVSTARARRDLHPTTAVERRHLARIRRTA